MKNNELEAWSNLIYNRLYSIDNKSTTREKEIQIIKSVLVDFEMESRKIGRTQVINYIQDSINELKN